MIKYPGIKKNAACGNTLQYPICHCVKVATPQCFSNLKFLLLCFLLGTDPLFATIEAFSCMHSVWLLL